MDNHTPTPWALGSAAPSLVVAYDKRGRAVSLADCGHPHEPVSRANAALIVRAVNAYRDPPAIDPLSIARDALQCVLEDSYLGQPLNANRACVIQVRAALKMLEGA